MSLELRDSAQYLQILAEDRPKDIEEFQILHSYFFVLGHQLRAEHLDQFADYIESQSSEYMSQLLIATDVQEALTENHSYMQELVHILIGFLSTI